MKINRRLIAAFALSVMLVFTMTPAAAFAGEEDVNNTTESEETSEAAEEVLESEGTQGVDREGIRAAEEDKEVLQLQKEAFEDTDRDLALYEFTHDGTAYTMEDISGYSKSMRIYVFYLGTGEEGDAVLIESNGRYLLMDTGHKNSAGRLVACLNRAMGGEKKLDVYFSHMHGDHTGGLEKVLLNFDVGRVFFPDIELCENYYTPNVLKTIDQIYKEHVALAETEAEVVFLRPPASVRSSNPRAANTASTFNVGGAVFEVIGPLGSYKPDDFIGYVKELNGRCGTKEGHCLNNSSLCTMVTCGNIRYLSTGDIEKQEEAKLTGRYGSGLNSDILKLPHHGLRTSGTSVFASKVTPMWSFEQNHGFVGAAQDALNTARKYGYNYAVAGSKRGIIYDISGDRVRVFRDYNDNCRPDDGLIRGWISCGGGTQYYDGSGYIRTGWNWLGGYAYYMSGSSGFRFTGSHRINGTKVKFSSSGKLTSHRKPSKVTLRYARAKAGGTVTVGWRKASRASRYQVYRADSRSGSYRYIATVSGKARSFRDSGLQKGKRYYYKVRAVRYVAGGSMYGSFSKARRIVAK